MKALFLTEGTRTSPASRIRVYQYLDRLAGEDGFEAETVSFTGEAACRALVAGTKIFPPRRVAEKLRQFGIWAGLRSRAARAEVLFIQRVLPPRGITARLAALKVPLVYDFDDAVYLGHAEREMRFRALLRAAARVTAVSEAAEREAVRLGAEPRNVTVLPSPVDCAAVSRRAPGGRRGEFTVGWIGSPATTPYLEAIWPELAAFAGDHPAARFLFVGARSFDAGALTARVRFEPWSADSDRSLPAQMDAGLMPLADDPWCRGKGGYKLIQYMAAGVACLASPVGANLEVVQEGQTGFFAAGAGQWRAQLNRLAADPALCDRLGAAGRERAEQHYDYTVTSEIFRQVLLEAGRGAEPPRLPL